MLFFPNSEILPPSSLALQVSQGASRVPAHLLRNFSPWPSCVFDPGLVTATSVLGSFQHEDEDMSRGLCSSLQIPTAENADVTEQK